MFGVSRDVIKPGCTFHELLRHRQETGTFTDDVDEYIEAILRKMAERGAFQRILTTADGRSIQVLYQPLADGGWVTTLEDFTERRRADEQIAHLAHYDALTDLPNRVLFRDQLERELKKIGRGGQLAVLYIDIDEFKSVNDFARPSRRRRTAEGRRAAFERLRQGNRFRCPTGRRRIRHRPDRRQESRRRHGPGDPDLPGDPRARRVSRPPAGHRRQHRHCARSAGRHRSRSAA